MNKAEKTRMLMENFNKYLTEEISGEELKSKSKQLKKEMWQYLKNATDGLADRKDYLAYQMSAETAIYYFATEYNSGMFSPLYSIASQSKYNPGPMENDINDTEDWLAIEMYELLVEKYGKMNI